MTTDLERLLDKNLQTSLADEIVTTVAAVASNALAPDSAVRALEQGVAHTLSSEQRDAAAALQYHGAACAGEILTAGLDSAAAQRTGELQAALENKCPPKARASLDDTPEAGAQFKSRMCRAIAGKCAELAAAEIDRLKKGKITILNKEDEEVFNQQHKQHQEKQAGAIVTFLAALPQRYPSFGAQLFSDIARQVQSEIGEKYKSPDIHAKVASLFKDAVAAMPSDARSKVSLPG